MKRNITKKKKGGSRENVLYLGMETDIAHAIRLVPSFTTLYSIGIKDTTFSNITTWKQDKKGMLKDLTEGGNYTQYRKGRCITMTSWGKSKIISEKDDKENNIWTVKFILNDKPRELIYYYNRNFFNDWPGEVKDIRHLIWIGSVVWETIRGENPDKIELDERDNLISLLETRTTNPFYVYGQTKKTRETANVMYLINNCDYGDNFNNPDFNPKNFAISRDLVDKKRKHWWLNTYIGY